MKTPMAIPALAFIAGILCTYSGAGIWAGIAALVLAAVVYIMLTIYSRDPVRGFRVRGYQGVWVALLFAGLGATDAQINLPYTRANDDFSGCVMAIGRIRSVSTPAYGDRCIVHVSELTDADGKRHRCLNFDALIQSDALTKATDDIVAFPARFTRITDSPNSLRTGYAERMARKGILYRVDLPDESIQLTGHSQSMTGISERCRRAVESGIEKTALERDTRFLLITLLLGDRSYLDEDTRTLFADAGVSHILALSGMHVGIIAAIFLVILFPLNFRGWYKQRIFLTALLLFVYAFLTGWAPSTVRACIMAATTACALLLERKNSGWNSLFLAIFIILLVTPGAIYDIGLQLSFICVASLIAFMRPLNPIDQHFHPRTYRIAGALLISIVATGASWAVTAAYFGQFPLMFLPANLLTVPLLPVYLGAAILYLCLHSAGIEPALLGNLLDKGYDGIRSLLGLMTDGGAATVQINVGTMTVVLWTGAVALLAWAVNSRKGETDISKKFISRRIRTYRMHWPWITAGAMMLAAIIAIPLGADGSEEALVTSGRNGVTVKTMVSGEEQTLKFAPGKVSSITMADKKLIAIDCNAEALKEGRTEMCDYLILTSSYRKTIADLKGKVEADTILLHSSMRRKREARLLHESDSLGQPCLPLRGRPHRIRLKRVQ